MATTFRLRGKRRPTSISEKSSAIQLLCHRDIDKMQEAVLASCGLWMSYVIRHSRGSKVLTTLQVIAAKK